MCGNLEWEGYQSVEHPCICYKDWRGGHKYRKKMCPHPPPSFLPKNKNTQPITGEQNGGGIVYFRVHTGM